jgi:hypothetical protein
MTEESQLEQIEQVEPEEPAAPAGEDAIRDLVRRLGRRHPSGGVVIERAAILAEAGAALPVIEWITRNGGLPEDAIASAGSSGLHGARQTQTVRAPLRYVVPPEALAG